MAIHLSLREDTAANWSSVNPVLAQGEIGCDLTNNLFKIGDGSTAWNSLSAAPTAQPSQTIGWQSLGDGSDSNLTLTSSTYTGGPLVSGALVRDAYFNNLIISGSGQIQTNGYKIFVKGVLDLTNASAGAIQYNGVAAGNASGATGGTGPSGLAAGSLAAQATGAIGATATTGAGGNGVTGGAGTNGGAGGASGLGGTGGSGAGGSAAGGSAVTNTVFIRRFATNLLRGATLIVGGAGGRGGSSGAGDGTNTGGGGGGTGSGGGVIAIYANVILRGSSTPSGVIQANGGNGGNGASTSTGVTGGGAGGGGGGGGWVYIAYNYLSGPTVTNFITTNGGAGGNGGNGFGTVLPTIGGGGGGAGGYGGRITLYNIVTQTTTAVFGYNSTSANPQVTTGASAIGLIGGDGGQAGINNITI